MRTDAVFMVFNIWFDIVFIGVNRLFLTCAWKSTHARSSSQREHFAKPCFVNLLPSLISIERELSINQYRMGHRFIVPEMGLNMNDKKKEIQL